MFKRFVLFIADKMGLVPDYRKNEPTVDNQNTYCVTVSLYYMFRSREVYQNFVVGLKKAYIDARYNALLWDIRTSGSDCGVCYVIERVID
jgi:hypothetical protein